VNLGAEPKKVAVLGGLGLVLLYVLYTNVIAPSTPDYAASNNTPRATLPSNIPSLATPPAQALVEAQRPVATKKNRESRDFRPTLRPRRPEDRIDVASVDPTLRTELLDRVRNVQVAGGMRSLFDLGSMAPVAPVAPKVPVPKIIPKKPVMGFIGPMPKPPDPPYVAPPKPVAPPIPLRFYGYIGPTRGPGKRAFFLDGEEILVVVEGDIAKSRYRLLRVGIDRVEMEDMQFPGQRQTLQITPEGM
jgi:hypothetical protein